jgi:hypothetical protein
MQEFGRYRTVGKAPDRTVTSARHHDRVAVVFLRHCHTFSFNEEFG